MLLGIAPAAQAAFPGANGRIAYTRGGGEGASSLWTANPDGAAATKLLDAQWVGGIAFSADGERLAFERDDTIEVMNADGSGRALLTTDGHFDPTAETTWEADYDDPHSDEVIPFVKVVTYRYRWDYYVDPAFSPDGSRLALAHSTGVEVEREICAVEALEEEECISEEPDRYTNREFDCEECVANIVAVDSRTGAAAGQLTAPSTSWSDSEPVYSVDGRLAFSRRDWTPPGIPREKIMVVGSPGAAPIAVTYGDADTSPDFTPDGGSIVYLREGRVATVPAGGGEITPSQLEAGKLVLSPDGRLVLIRRDFLGPNESPGLFTGTFGVGALTPVVNGGDSPAWQPTPPPPPPPPVLMRAKAKAKKKLRLNRRGKAVIGTIKCGSTDCRLTPLRAWLKISKRRYALRAILPKRLPGGKSTKVRIAVRGNALAKLKMAGRGKLSAKVRVTDATGRRAVTFKPAVQPPRAKKNRR